MTTSGVNRIRIIGVVETVIHVMYINCLNYTNVSKIGFTNNAEIKMPTKESKNEHDLENSKDVQYSRPDGMKIRNMIFYYYIINFIGFF